MSWPPGKLSDIAQVISGFAFKSEWFGTGDAKVVRIGDLKGGKVDLDSAQTFDSKAKHVSDQFRIKCGDILMALSGATTGKIAAADTATSGAFLNQRVAIVRGKRQENTDYLKYVFSGSPLQKLLIKAGGAAQPNLSPKDLADMEIPLPPLKEQKRIAAILDKADELRRKRRQALALLDSLTQSIFLEMFGCPSRNSKKYPLVRIGDLLSSATYGTSAKAGAEGAYPVLRMGNLSYSGNLELADLKYIDLPEKEVEKYTLKRGDILFNRTNSVDLVGKTAVFDLDEAFAFAGYLVRGRAKPGVSPWYISGYLNSAHGKAVLRNMAKNIVGMANINAKEFQLIEILAAPEAEQRRYEELLSAVRSRKFIEVRLLDQVEALFTSLQSRAFNGDL